MSRGIEPWSAVALSPGQLMSLQSMESEENTLMKISAKWRKRIKDNLPYLLAGLITTGAAYSIGYHEGFTDAKVIVIRAVRPPCKAGIRGKEWPSRKHPWHVCTESGWKDAK